MATHLENEIGLVSEAQSGDVEAYGVLVNHYERRIYRVICAVTKDPADAEDALQETFLKAYSKLKYFRGESRFCTWLVRIALNEALGKLRRRNPIMWVSLDERFDMDEPASAPREIEDGRDNPEESYSKAELRAILSKAIKTLETPMQVVFVLRDVEGLSTEEAASVLGVSTAVIKTRLMRARLRLRKILNIWLRGCFALAAK